METERLLSSSVFTDECFIAKGADSDVFKYKDSVYKRYLFTRGYLADPEPTLTKVEFEQYISVTNKAAQLLQETPFEIRREGLSIPVCVNPVGDYWWTTNGNTEFGVSRSLHIEGDKLRNVYREDLDNLSAYLNRELGVRGISVIPLNCKLIDGQSAPKLVVTDLCAGILELET